MDIINIFKSIFGNIANSYDSPVLSRMVIMSVLLVVLLLSIYEFIVYRLVSRRAFYNRSFNICLSVLPFFISTIVLCLQSNIVITLGTIGALAIIRFRTAVKNPVDMLYLLWSVHIGITCGCQLYEVGILTSLLVTVVLIFMENVTFGGKPFLLVFHCLPDYEKNVMTAVERGTKKYRVKSRAFSEGSVDCVVELSVSDLPVLVEELKSIGLEKFSIIEYDSDDIL